MPYAVKEGVMKRATIAWVVMNIIMGITLAFAVYILNPWMENWYIALPLLVGVIVSELIITSETIAPILRGWIKQEQYLTEKQLEDAYIKSREKSENEKHSD